jgi:ElaB/YqjD/DUF883 family membrane-anchored ribosome-binding protein
MSTTHDSSINPNTLSRSNSGPRATSLGEQTSKVAEDVRELGNIALSGAGDAIQSVKERGSEVLGQARERGEQLLEKGKVKAEAAREGFEGYVAENPFKTVLIAAGIGALIGYSLRSRN